MAKKKFSGFAELTRNSAEPAPMIDREVLRKTVDDGVRDVATVKSIRIDRIRPDPAQPRKHFDPVRLRELADSIGWQGVLDPIKVQYIREGDYFLLIDGQRRYMASQLAGLTEIPAIIRDPSADERFLQQLIENLQREDLNDVERALALQRLKTLTGHSWQKLADLVGLTKRRILQLGELTELPKPLQEDIIAGKLSDKHARALRKLPEPLLEPARAAVKAQKLTGDQTIRLVERLNRPIENEPAAAESAREPMMLVAATIEEVVNAPKVAASRPADDAAGRPASGATVIDITSRMPQSPPAGPVAAPGAIERLQIIAGNLAIWDPSDVKRADAPAALTVLDEISATVERLRSQLRSPRTHRSR